MSMTRVNAEKRDEATKFEIDCECQLKCDGICKPNTCLLYALSLYFWIQLLQQPCAFLCSRFPQAFLLQKEIHAQILLSHDGVIDNCEAPTPW